MRAITTTSEYRRSTIMAIVLIAISAFVAAMILRSVYDIGVAHADPVSVVADVGSGSASAPADTGPAYHDPTVDPSGFITDVVRLWREGGWAVTLLLLLVGGLETTAWLGKNQPSLAWLAKGRVSIALGGGLAVAMAALAAAADGGHWSAVLTALVAAVLAFWHPAGTDPAKA